MEKLLVKTDLPISRIIEKAGYSTNHAVSLFKSETGLSMSQYRKQNK